MCFIFSIVSTSEDVFVGVHFSKDCGTNVRFLGSLVSDAIAPERGYFVMRSHFIIAEAPSYQSVCIFLYTHYKKTHILYTNTIYIHMMYVHIVCIVILGSSQKKLVKDRTTTPCNVLGAVWLQRFLLG